MLRLLITLGIILFINLFYVVLFDEKFGRTLPVTYVTLVLVLFISSLLGKLSYFKYILLAIVIATIIFYLYIFKCHRIDFKKIRNNYLRFSTFVFILIFIYLYYLLLNVELSNIDDLYHWGAMVKDIIRNDVLYSNTQYVMVNPGAYPPFSTLLCGLFNKLLGGYNESWSLLGMSSFIFSCFVMIIDDIEFKPKSIFKGILLTFISIALTLCIQQNESMVYKTFFYNCTYVDWLLAVLIARGFYDIYKFKYTYFDYISIMLIVIGLSLTKQTGLPFCLLLIVTLFIKIIIDRENNAKNIIHYLVFSFIIPIAIYSIWNIYMKQFSNQLAIGSSLNVVSGAANTLSGGTEIQEWQIVTFFNCINAFFNKPILIHPFNIAYAPFVLLCSVLIWLINIKSKNNIIISIFYLLGGIGYALVLLISYSMLFGVSEGPGLIMFGRYAQTYTYAGMLLLVWIAIDKYFKFRYLLTVLLIVAFFVEPNSVDTIIINKDRIPFRYKEITGIEEWIYHEYNYQNVFVVNQTDIAYKMLIRYTFAEKGENVSYYQAIDESNYNDFGKYLEKNEYVLIGDTDDRFYYNCWKPITDTPLYNSTLYRIVDDGDGYDFEMIYTWDE